MPTLNPPRIGGGIVDPMGNCAAKLLDEDVMDADLLGFAPRPPLPSVVPDVADQLFPLSCRPGRPVDLCPSEVRPPPCGSPGDPTRPEEERLFALAGLGIARLPDFLVASDLGEGRLIALPSPTAETIEVHVLHPERRLRPARVRLFIDMPVEELA